MEAEAPSGFSRCPVIIANRIRDQLTTGKGSISGEWHGKHTGVESTLGVKSTKDWPDLICKKAWGEPKEEEAALINLQRFNEEPSKKEDGDFCKGQQGIKVSCAEDSRHG